MLEKNEKFKIFWKVLFFTLIFQFLWSHQGLPASAYIEKIYKTRKEASVFFFGTYRAGLGRELLAWFKNGLVCFLKIKEIYDRKALVDIERCPYKDFLRPGQSLSKWEKIEQDVYFSELKTRPLADEKKEDIWKELEKQKKLKAKTDQNLINRGPSFLILFPLKGNLEGEVMDGPDQVKINGEMINRFGLGIEYFFMKLYGLGWSLGYNLEMKGGFKKLSSISGGVEKVIERTAGPFFMNTFYAGINFSFWKKIYVFGGASISLSLEKETTIDLRPGMGIYFGLGKIFFEHFIVEAQYRMMNFRGSQKLDGKYLEFTKASINGPLMTFKYLFY